MADQWYRYAEGFLLVYSITDRQSFINLNKMHKDILRVKERGKKDVACIVVSQKVRLATLMHAVQKSLVCCKRH
jgi:GTPase SAR1 family protein